jgi:hypothetical protein
MLCSAFFPMTKCFVMLDDLSFGGESVVNTRVDCKLVVMMREKVTHCDERMKSRKYQGPIRWRATEWSTVTDSLKSSPTIYRVLFDQIYFNRSKSLEYKAPKGQHEAKI